ncbi:MAG: transcriptional repressor LexA [bacterium]|nr:transcriptional repressor LexA [bacterium]
MTIGLTDRQEKVMEFIRDWIESRGYPPTIRDIQKPFGIKSTNGVKVHLDALEKKGYIIRNPGISRGIELTELSGKKTEDDMQRIPVIGRIAAGAPILAEQNYEDELVVDNRFVRAGKIFALEVRGDSMVEAGIFNGDYVIAKHDASYFPGDIVVAVIGDEATVKRYYRDTDRVRLEPANSAYGPIIVDEETPGFYVAGKVVALQRKM